MFCASFQEAKCAAAWHKDWKGNLYEFYFGRYHCPVSAAGIIQTGCCIGKREAAFSGS